jgi:hypothetical protein
MRLRSILVLAACVAFAAWVLFSLFRVEPVHVLESRLEHRGGEVFVSGRIQNTGVSHEPLNLEVLYYDANGRKLGQDSVAIQDLAQGATAPFQSAPRALPGASTFSIHVNRGRNPYGN